MNKKIHIGQQCGEKEKRLGTTNEDENNGHEFPRSELI